MSWIWDEKKQTYVYVPAAGKGGTDYTQDPSYQNVTTILQNANAAFKQHMEQVKNGKVEYDPNFMKPYEMQIAVADSINSEIKAKYDAALAQESKGVNAAASAARKEEAARIKAIDEARARAAGESSAKFLESSAATQKADSEKKIKDLYGGLQTSAKDRLDLMLKQLETDTAAASKTITDAGDAYSKSFKPSTGYTAPVTTLNVAENPLLAALEQQGAGTGEVQAATNLAQQTAGATSDLQKWAMGQLNVGQQNYEAGMQNVNAQALQAALATLASNKSKAGTGFQYDYSSQVDKINADQAAAQAAADAEIQKLINEAAKIRASTTLQTGATPVAGSKDARTQAIATAPSQYANFAAAVKALNPNFDEKKAGKTAVQAFPELAKAFGKKTK